MNDRTFRLKPFVVLDGDANDAEGVMVDTRNATMCACNGTAWALLAALKASARVKDMADRLAADFDVGKRRAQKDVMTFIQQLAAMDLVDET